MAQRLHAHNARRQLQWSLCGLCLIVAACGCAGEPDDPTEPIAGIVALDRPDQPLDVQAPPSQFNVPDGAEVWQRAWQRASSAPAEGGGGFFNATELLGEGFRYARDFRSERDSGDELQVVVEAAEAVRRDNQIQLTEMQITHFISNSPLPFQARRPDAKGKHGAELPAPAAKDKASAGPEGLPYGGRVVIRAPKAVIDLKTNEGRATGAVTVTIFPKAEAGKPVVPLAVLTTERLYWRTWGEPSIGANELALYTRADKGEPDPLVTANFTLPQPDGTTITTVIRARGMIYESGTYDKLNTVYDDEWRTAGRTTVERNRAIFRSDVRLETTATTMAALVPFQAPAGAPAANHKKDDPKAAPAAPAPPSKTVISCAGPAVFNLAAVPRVKKTPGKEPAAEGEANQDPAALKPILLGRRFEFLNDVSMLKTPLDEQAAPADRTEMSCRHLCLQYPPESLPGMGTFPEYAEALGGVRMRGTNTTGSSATAAPAPAAPFTIDCQRVFFDNLNDNMFLVGAPDKPVVVKSDKGEAVAQQFNYRSRAETFTMPATGPKRLVLNPGAAGPGGSGAVSFASGQTIIQLRGTLSRERKLLPVPNGPPRVREVLTVRDNVVIEQPQGALRMRGAKIQFIRALPSGEIEALDGEGATSVTMGDLQASGETFSVDITPAKPGEPARKHITVTGSRKNETKASLFQAGSAMRADKFIIEMADDQVKTFRALGGTVAVFTAPPPEHPEPPKPQVAQDAAALFKGISFEPGGNMVLQCDGEFAQDADRKVVIKQNVMIKQPGTQLLADEVRLTLDDAPTAAAPSAATALFSGGLKSIECYGGVELASADQLVQCDRLIHDIKNDTSMLLMDDPENDVRLYLREDSGSTRFLSIQKSLDVDQKNGLFRPGGMLLMLPYRPAQPAPRDKNSSPAKKKKKTLDKRPVSGAVEK